MLGLDEHPERCPIVPERAEPDRPIRVLRDGRQPHIYLVYFIVDASRQVVRVLHVRRGARQPPTPGDLKERRGAE